MENLEEKRNRALKVYFLLNKKYFRVPLLFLNYKTDAQLLCAIILSAQSTDAQVNKVTRSLFKKYKSVDDFATADILVFRKEIFSTGFYKNKAKNVINCFKKINSDFNGKIPLNISDLISLPGVGRKTANLVLANKGIVCGIAVDTHVYRLSRRLGFSNANSADKVEQDLMQIFPKKNWSKINGLLISHGRSVCFAKNPSCSSCFLLSNGLCPQNNMSKNVG